MPQTQSY